ILAANPGISGSISGGKLNLVIPTGMLGPDCPCNADLLALILPQSEGGEPVPVSSAPIECCYEQTCIAEDILDLSFDIPFLDPGDRIRFEGMNENCILLGLTEEFYYDGG